MAFLLRGQASVKTERSVRVSPVQAVFRGTTRGHFEAIDGGATRVARERPARGGNERNDRDRSRVVCDADDGRIDGGCTAWPLAKITVRDAEEGWFFPDVTVGHSPPPCVAAGMPAARKGE